MIFLRIIKESILFALQSLKVNKLRTILSLTGITIGIFAMISVFAVVDSLEREIRNSVSRLGDDVVYIQKWPWEFSRDYAWWKYLKRPVPSIEEYKAIKDRAHNIHSCTFMASTSSSVNRGGVSSENAGVLVATHDYNENRPFEIDNGRYFSKEAAHQGKNYAIIGAEIAADLFPSTSPVGREISVSGHKIVVIGVFEKEGESMVSDSHDNLVLLMSNYGKRIFDIDSESMNPMIMVTAAEGVSLHSVKDELEIIMRSERRIKPMEEADFALNRASMISQGIDKIFATIDLAAIIIGAFAILVGGFGIANIMFVSVRERTRIIGIQKAIGAKSVYILTQFLFEAVFLSLIGGMIGLVLIWLGTIIGSQIIDFNLVLGLNNIVLGLVISGFIGIMSGFMPARQASKLDPVKAMGSV